MLRHKHTNELGTWKRQSATPSLLPSPKNTWNGVGGGGGGGGGGKQAYARKFC